MVSHFMSLILPVLLVLGLLTLIGRLIVFLFDTVSDMSERTMIPEPVRVARVALAMGLIVALIALGWALVRTIPSLG